jgi:hypothetical protein
MFDSFSCDIISSHSSKLFILFMCLLPHFHQSLVHFSSTHFTLIKSVCCTNQISLFTLCSFCWDLASITSDYNYFERTTSFALLLPCVLISCWVRFSLLPCCKYTKLVLSSHLASRTSSSSKTGQFQAKFGHSLHHLLGSLEHYPPHLVGCPIS